MGPGSPPRSMAAEPPPLRGRRALGELALLFLRLGTTAFGGPAVHIAMMEDEVVRRRRWLSREEFLDLLGATNLIPGPSSTELAIHIGHRRAGWLGLIVAGLSFILPAALMTAALGWAYVRYGRLPAVSGVLYGVKPVIIAVVLQALWGLGRAAVKTRELAVLAVATVAAAGLGVNEILLLFGAGTVIAGVRTARRRGHRDVKPVGAFLGPAAPAFSLGAAAIGATAASSVHLGSLFLVFVKIGSLLFGSGYVLLAFLRSELVQRLGWLTEAQLLDAVAVGQITPGPVFTTATFVGYIIRGGPGAAVATAGIFLPAFFFVALSGPLVPRIRGSAFASSFLDGVNVASLALMAVVTWQLGRAALVDVWSCGIALVGAVLLFWRRVSSVWLALGGAAMGLLARALL